MAIVIRVIQAKGMENCIEASYIGKARILLCIFVIAASESICIIAQELIAGLFTEDLQVQTQAIQFLFMGAIFQFSD